MSFQDSNKNVRGKLKLPKSNQTWTKLREDLRASIPDATIAVILSGVLFAVMAARVKSGSSAAIASMPGMLIDGGIWPYTMSQAIGWIALLWAWATILLGLSMPVFVWQRRPTIRKFAEQLHRSGSLTVISLTLAHGVLLCWDKMNHTMLTMFAPWTSSYVEERFTMGLGTISFYLVVLFGLSFYLRDRMGRRTWRWLHQYVVPGSYILAVWHAFAYGSDVSMYNPLWTVLWIMQIPVIAAFALRLFVAARPRAAVSKD